MYKKVPSLKGKRYFISIHTLQSLVHEKTGKKKKWGKEQENANGYYVCFCVFTTLYTCYTYLTMLT